MKRNEPKLTEPHVFQYGDKQYNPGECPWVTANCDLCNKFPKNKIHTVKAG